MNLLVFSPWFPCPPDNGSRLRAFHILDKLAKAGHRIRLVTGMQDDIAANADLARLESICDTVRVFPWKWHDGSAGSGLRNKLTALVSSTPRSIAETDNPPLREAIAEELALQPDACLAMELAAAPFIPADTFGVPVALDQIEVSGVVRAVTEAKSAKARLQATLTRSKHDSYWRGSLRRFAALTAVSEEEAAAIRHLVGAEGPAVTVVPNGVEADFYPRRTGGPIPGRIIYNGALTYGPNRDAVAWFVRDILPKIAERIPEAHLVVTGRYDAEAEKAYSGLNRVILTGFLQDLRPTLLEAALCAVPLLGGGGTRLKILEAWAAGLPVVSTTVGAVGLAGSEDEVHLLRADSVDDFASACVRVLGDPGLAERLSENGRDLVHARYDWSAIVGQITELLGTLRST